MNNDIALIQIDESGRLCVFPKSASFPLIYRAGLEVQWDSQSKYLYSPPPREWSYARWFLQITEAVKGEYGVTLITTPDTQWRNIDDSLKLELAPGVNGTASA